MPLKGITILDLSRMISGPYCTMLLADLGAQVIKVEPPEGDENRQIGPPFPCGEGPFYLGANRNKESIVVDISLPEGRAVVHRLARHADVVIHNFRPEAARHFGVDYETIRTLRPDVVYCAINAFGETGPYANRGGTDLIIQGMSGLMSVTGDPAGLPVRAGTPVADVTTALFAAYAVLAALYRRKETGEGERIEVPMLAVAVAIQSPTFAYAYGLGGVPPRTGSRSQISIAGDFATRDGRLNVAIPTDKFWRRLCRAIDRPDLLADPRLATNRGRLDHQEEVYAELDRVFRQKAVAEWEEVLGPQGLICGPVLDYEQVRSHPQVEHMGIFQDCRHATGETMPMVVNPIRFAHAALPAPQSPPLLGGQTEAVLRRYQFTEAEIVTLRDLGVTVPRPLQSAGGK